MAAPARPCSPVSEPSARTVPTWSAHEFGSVPAVAGTGPPRASARRAPTSSRTTATLCAPADADHGASIRVDGVPAYTCLRGAAGGTMGPVRARRYVLTGGMTALAAARTLGRIVAFPFLPGGLRHVRLLAYDERRRVERLIGV